jgi:amidase
MTTTQSPTLPIAPLTPGGAPVPVPGAAELAAAIRDGRASSRDAVEACLARIAASNQALNAVVTLDEAGARAAADEADRAVRDGGPLGPLHGVPVTIKDTFETAGIRSTAGSRRMASYVPKRDATAVARLRAAGAIVLGKTNTPEFAMGAETRNPVFGLTRNPWDPARTTGGSSGGSAAAIAAGFSALDIGSDIGGSIRAPAHFCGVFGLKPTDNLVSPIGHVPPPPGRPWGLLRYLLSIGPLARSIEDLVVALEAIAGPDVSRPDVPPVPLVRSPAPDVAALRIGWWDDFGAPITADTRRVLDDAVARLGAAGVRVQRAAPEGFDAPALAALASEIQMAATSARSTPLHLPRVVLRGASRVVARYDPAVAGFARGAGATLGSMAAALSRRDVAIARFETFLDGHDAWLVPVAAMPAFPHLPKAGLVEQLRARVDIGGVTVPLVLALEAFASPFNLTGSPVVVLPAGRSSDGMPIGLQLVGRRWNDMPLLAVAAAAWGVVGAA